MTTTIDLDLVQEVSALRSDLCDGIHLGNSSSDSHSPGYSASSNGVVGMSDSSAITNSDISYRDELNHKSGSDLPYGAYRIRRSRSRNNRDKTRKDSLHGEKFTDCHPLVKNENSPEVVASVREKRQRKPPQRYIEESSNSKKEQHSIGRSMGNIMQNLDCLSLLLIMLLRNHMEEVAPADNY